MQIKLLDYSNVFLPMGEMEGQAEEEVTQLGMCQAQFLGLLLARAAPCRVLPLREPGKGAGGWEGRKECE